MRSINISLPSNQFGNVRRLLDVSAPVLEQIRLRLQDISLYEFFPPHSLFFRSQFSALGAVYLEDYPIDFDRYVPVMTNGLTTLVLYNREHRDRCHLLEYLEHCKDLIHLKINLPNLRGTVPASRIVSPEFKRTALGLLVTRRSPPSFLSTLREPPHRAAC